MTLNAKRPLFLITLSILSHYIFASDPTHGFNPISLKEADFDIQKPHDVSLSERYSYKDGIHVLSVCKNDKHVDHENSGMPRTELTIKGHGYSHGVYQFEGYVFVPTNTSGVRIIRIVDSNSDSAFALWTLKGKLLYAGKFVYLARNIYDKWLRINLIHNIETKTVEVFVDGALTYVVHQLATIDDRFYFTFGVYPTLSYPSRYMESRWKEVKIFKKDN